MKKFLSTAAVAALAVGVAAGPATAAKSITRSGKLTSYVTKTGKLTVVNARTGKAVYSTKNANCGVSYGQSGDQINCKTLGSAKYAHHRVMVTFHRAANGSRVAEIVSVDMSQA